MEDLIELYPDHLHNDVFKKLLKVQQIELEKEEQAIEMLINEFNVETATYSLPIWSKFAGIEDNIELDISTRRSNILAAFKVKAITTIQVIKEVAESYSNGTCEVIENYSDYSFIIRFISVVGIPPKIDEIKKIIDKIKPAHLNYSFEFRYRTWDDIKKLGSTWDDIKALNKTWDNLREGVI